MIKTRDEFLDENELLPNYFLTYKLLELLHNIKKIYSALLYF